MGCCCSCCRSENGCSRPIWKPLSRRCRVAPKSHSLDNRAKSIELRRISDLHENEGDNRRQTSLPPSVLSQINNRVNHESINDPTRIETNQSTVSVNYLPCNIQEACRTSDNKDDAQQIKPTYTPSEEKDVVRDKGVVKRFDREQTDVGLDQLQLPPLYGLLRVDSLSYSELSEALSPLKALICEVQLCNVGDQRMNDCLSRLKEHIENLVHTTSFCSNRYKLCQEERDALIKALNLVDPNEPGVQDNAAANPVISRTDQDLRHPNFDRLIHELSIIVQILSAASSTRQLSRQNYHIIRKDLTFWQNEKFAHFSATTSPMLLIPTSVKCDVGQFLRQMEFECRISGGMLRINGPLHNTVCRLLDYLTQVRLSLTSEPIINALKTLYACTSKIKVMDTENIALNTYQTSFILQALKIAQTEHRNSAKLQSSESMQNHTWTLSAQIAQRLESIISKDQGNSLSIIDYKEALLIQHVLLSSLSTLRQDRTATDKAADTKFFKHCSEIIRFKTDDQRYIDTLSPILEHGTPDISACAMDIAHIDSTNATNTPSSDRSRDQSLELDDPNTGAVTSCQASGQFLISPKSIELTKETSLTEAYFDGPIVVAEISVIRPVATYLHSKILELNTGLAPVNQGHANGQVLTEVLASLNAILLASEQSSEVGLPSRVFRSIQDILETENNPYSQVLNRSLAKFLSGLPSSQGVSAFVGPKAQDTMLGNSPLTQILHSSNDKDPDNSGQQHTIDSDRHNTVGNEKINGSQQVASQGRSVQALITANSEDCKHLKNECTQQVDITQIRDIASKVLNYESQTYVNTTKAVERSPHHCTETVPSDVCSTMITAGCALSSVLPKNLIQTHSQFSDGNTLCTKLVAFHIFKCVLDMVNGAEDLRTLPWTTTQFEILSFCFESLKDICSELQGAFSADVDQSFNIRRLSLPIQIAVTSMEANLTFQEAIKCLSELDEKIDRLDGAPILPPLCTHIASELCALPVVFRMRQVALRFDEITALLKLAQDMALGQKLRLSSLEKLMLTNFCSRLNATAASPISTALLAEQKFDTPEEFKHADEILPLHSFATMLSHLTEQNVSRTNSACTFMEARLWIGLTRLPTHGHICVKPGFIEVFRQIFYIFLNDENQQSDHNPRHSLTVENYEDSIVRKPVDFKTDSLLEIGAHSWTTNRNRFEDTCDWISTESPVVHLLTRQLTSTPMDMQFGSAMQYYVVSSLLQQFVHALEQDVSQNGIAQMSNREYQYLRAVLQSLGRSCHFQNLVDNATMESLAEVIHSKKFQSEQLTLKPVDLLQLHELSTHIVSDIKQYIRISTMRFHIPVANTQQVMNAAKRLATFVFFAYILERHIDFIHFPQLERLTEIMDELDSYTMTDLSAKLLQIEYIVSRLSSGTESHSKDERSEITELTTALIHVTRMQNSLHKFRKDNVVIKAFRWLHYAVLCNHLEKHSRLGDSEQRLRFGQLLILQLLQIIPTDQPVIEQVEDRLEFYRKQLVNLLTRVCGMLADKDEEYTSNQKEEIVRTLTTLIWSYASNQSRRQSHPVELFSLCEKALRRIDGPSTSRSQKPANIESLLKLLQARTASALAEQVQLVEFQERSKKLLFDDEMEVLEERQIILVGLAACLHRITSDLGMTTSTTVVSSLNRILEEPCTSNEVISELSHSVNDSLTEIGTALKQQMLNTLEQGMHVTRPQADESQKRSHLKHFTRISAPFCVLSKQRTELIDERQLADALRLATIINRRVPGLHTQVAKLLHKLRHSTSLCDLRPEEVNLAHRTLNLASGVLTGTVQQTDRMEPVLPVDPLRLAKSLDFTDHQRLEPVTCAAMSEQISRALGISNVQRALNNKEMEYFETLSQTLFSAAIDEHGVHLSDLSEMYGYNTANMLTRLMRVAGNSDHNYKDKLIERLNCLRTYSPGDEHVKGESVSLGLNASVPTTQSLDSKTTAMLHHCLLTQLDTQPAPSLAIMLPLLTVLSELEASKELVTDGVDLPQGTSYVPMDITTTDLYSVTEWLQSSQATTPTMSEQVTALTCIHCSMDGQPLWPSEAALLVSSLETLETASDVARRQLISDLQSLKQRLMQFAFAQDCEEDLYEGFGLEFDKNEVKCLQTLHRVCEISVTRKVRVFVQSILAAWSENNQTRMIRDQEDGNMFEVVRLFLLYLSRLDALSVTDVINFNHTLIALGEKTIDCETVCLIRESLDKSELFALFETDTNRMSGHIMSNSLKLEPRVVSAQVPNALDQLLKTTDSDEPISFHYLLLLTAALHTFKLVHNQQGYEQLAAKWTSHIDRLVWRITCCSLLQKTVKLDVRSRALISLASKHYRSMLSTLCQDEIGRLIFHSGDVPMLITRLSDQDKIKLAEVLCIVLTDPIRYRTTPNRAGFMFLIVQSLLSNSDRKYLTAQESQLIVDTLSHRVLKGEGEPDSLVNLLINLQAVKQFLGRASFQSSYSRSITPFDSAVLAGALHILSDVNLQQSQFQSWDTEETSAISMKCQSVVGIIQLNLSLFLNQFLNPESFRLPEVEWNRLNELTEYWKPRLILDSQRRRARSIRKLCVSAECDLTADMTNGELVHAVRLAVLTSQSIQPQNAWFCVKMLERLAGIPASDYMSITELERESVRLVLCSTRSIQHIWSEDANFWSSVCYVSSFLTSLPEGSVDCATLGLEMDAADAGALTASLRCISAYLTSASSCQRLFIEELEQRMCCTAVNMDHHWILPSEATILLDTLSNLRSHVQSQFADEFGTFTRNLSAPNAEMPEEFSVALDMSQQKRLSQLLRVCLLLGYPLCPQDRNSLVALIDHLKCAHPALLEQHHRQHLMHLSHLLSTDRSLDQWTVFSPNLIRSDLQLLTQRALFSGEFIITSTEAIMIFGLLQHFITSARFSTPTLALLQSSLSDCITSECNWSLWAALPDTTRNRLVDNLRELTGYFLRFLDTNFTQEHSTRLDLLAILINRLFTEISVNAPLQNILSLLEYTRHIVPYGMHSMENVRLKRSAHVENESVDNTDAPDMSDVLFHTIDQIERAIDDPDDLVQPEHMTTLMVHMQSLLKNEDVFKLAQPDRNVVEESLQSLFAVMPMIHSSTAGKGDFHQTLSVAPLKSLIQRLRQTSCQTDVRSLKVTEEESVRQQWSHLESSFDNTPPQHVVEFITNFDHSAKGIIAMSQQLYTLTNTQNLAPEQLIEVTTIIEDLHRRACHLSPRIKDCAQFNDLELSLLHEIKQSVLERKCQKLSTESVETLRTLGQRLSSLAVQSDQDLLRQGLELWLTASVNGCFKFDEKETQRLHLALCLAREVVPTDPHSTSDLETLQQVIEQCASTLDSGIGTELTGPYSMGPVVTGVLEEAHKAYDLFSSRCSTLSSVLSPVSEWSVNHHSHIHKRLDSNVVISQSTIESTWDALDTERALFHPGEHRTTANCDKLETSVPRKDQQQTAGQIRSKPFSDQVILPRSIQTDSHKSIMEGARHSEDQAANYNHIMTAVAKEQQRLKTWEKLVETRLSQACDRVESLLSNFPYGCTKDPSSESEIVSQKKEELNRLREEVLEMKDQLTHMVQQLEYKELMNSGRADFAKLQPSIQGDYSSTSQIPVSQIFPSGLSREPTESEGSRRFQSYRERIDRLYRSSDCLKYTPNPSTSLPRRSHLILYKPLEMESLDLSMHLPKPYHLSSLDRLHKLIEIRRAVVAGSREELCRLGVYSSLPLNLPKRSSTVSPTDTKAQTSLDQNEVGTPRLLHTLLERQRNYTQHLLGRACYEQRQSSQILDALEQRLNKLEQQISPVAQPSSQEMT